MDGLWQEVTKKIAGRDRGWVRPGRLCVAAVSLVLVLGTELGQSLYWYDDRGNNLLLSAARATMVALPYQCRTAAAVSND